MYVDFYKRSFDRRTDTRSGTGRENLRKRIKSIVLCTNWVCAGAFVDYECLTPRTIFQQEEDEILSMALDFKIDVPCVVRWSLLWFSAPTDLNRILGTELKIEKYHEVVNGAIMDAIVKPFWRETQSEVVYANLGDQGPTAHHRERGINKEVKAGRVKEKHTPSSSDGDDDEEQSSNEII